MAKAIMHTENGETHSLSEWARITGYNYTTIMQRYHAGKPIMQLRKPEPTGEWPCEGCRLESQGCMCTAWRVWFHREWTGIQEAARRLKGAKR